MTILLEATAAVESAPYVFSLGVVGCMAAVTIGSIAWYNSKRPAGWEGKERPNIVPNVEK